MLPEKVKISGIDYEVYEAENKAAEEGYKLQGEITYGEARIYINEDQNEQLKQATLIHEIVHGILFHMGSEMNDNEKFVEGFSSGLFQVMRDNNWLIGDTEDKLYKIGDSND